MPFQVLLGLSAFCSFSFRRFETLERVDGKAQASRGGDGLSASFVYVRLAVSNGRTLGGVASPAKTSCDEARNDSAQLSESLIHAV
jgi:hypothetical protein